MRNIVAPGTDDEYVEKLLLVCELAASLLRTNSTTQTSWKNICKTKKF